MFENLFAEMARKRVTKRDIAKIIGTSEGTLTRKLNGDSQFALAEAYTIRDFLGEEHAIEYLFNDLEFKREVD